MYALSSSPPLYSHAFFECKNGYLLENPLLENLVEKICFESTNVANICDMDLDIKDMIKKTKCVIRKTSDNYSSMFQSIKYGKKTEIDSINRIIVKKGKEKKVDVFLNSSLVYLVKSK